MPLCILNRQGSHCARVGDAVNVGKTYVGDLKGESDTREFYRVPAGFSARRDRLVQDLVRKCRDGGMAVVSAPAGFGKTALLLQYADSIKEDMTRGDVGLIDAQGMRPAELGERLRRLQRDIAPTASPVVIVDNMPRLIRYLICAIRASRSLSPAFPPTMNSSRRWGRARSFPLDPCWSSRENTLSGRAYTQSRPRLMSII